MQISSRNFFNDNSLENLQFYYYLPDFDWKKKAELSVKIQENKGVKIIKYFMLLLIEKFVFTLF